MEELINALYELIEGGKLSNANVKVTEDADGNLTLTYAKPKKDEELEKIKKEINDMDDEIFEEASAELKNTDLKSFEILTHINTSNSKTILPAYNSFKKCVTKIVNRRIKSLSEEVNRLYSYISKPE